MTVTRTRTTKGPTMTSEHGAIGHGNTVAAWVAVAIMIIGFVIGGVAMWFSSAVGFWVGVGVVILGAIVGKVLQVMGLGQVNPSEREPAA